jgi:tetratricopeptide (TPR) repeat protein
MTFDEILHEITGRLTGDNEKDIKYLLEQSEKYKEHEYSKEISRALGRMMYEILPSDKKGEFERLISNDKKGTDNIIEEIKFQMYKKDYNKALEIFQSFIKDLNEEKDIFADDTVSEYHCFQNFLEELIYKVIYQPAKEIRQAPEDFSSLYFLYGNLLFELGKYDDAYTALTKAEKYNCINTDIKFEKGEILKIRKDWDKYLENNKKCLQCAYSSKAIARVYRNFAYYYSDIGEYNTAIALLFLSAHYDKGSTIAQSELMYISEKANMKIERPSSDDIKAILKQEDIQLGPNTVILEICATLGTQAKDENPEAAIFLFSVLYDLTDDDDIKKIIDSLQSRL